MVEDLAWRSLSRNLERNPPDPSLAQTTRGRDAVARMTREHGDRYHRQVRSRVRREIADDIPRHRTRRRWKQHWHRPTRYPWRSPCARLQDLGNCHRTASTPVPTWRWYPGGPGQSLYIHVRWHGRSAEHVRV